MRDTPMRPDRTIFIDREREARKLVKRGLQDDDEFDPVEINSISTRSHVEEQEFGQYNPVVTTASIRFSIDGKDRMENIRIDADTDGECRLSRSIEATASEARAYLRLIKEAKEQAGREWADLNAGARWTGEEEPIT